MTTMIPKVDTLLEAMTNALRDTIDSRRLEQPLMVGIHTGGVWVARELHARLGLESRLGELDISFYRDDFSRIGMHPQVKTSNLPFSVDDADIILVDDVLFTGRTIRAAMNELFDFGRPASITLAVLVDRSGRELPIEASVVGSHLELDENEQVKLTGPDPLELTLVTTRDKG